MNIIEAIEMLKSQRFEPMEINGETVLIPMDGFLIRKCCDVVVHIEPDIDGVADISYYRTIKPEIRSITTWGVGGNMSSICDWLVVDTIDNLRCEDILATDWEFEPYQPDTEREINPDVDIVYCSHNCLGMHKDGCEVQKDYIPCNISAIHVSCPYLKNRELIENALGVDK